MNIGIMNIIWNNKNKWNPSSIGGLLFWLKNEVDKSGVRTGTVHQRNCLEGDGSVYIKFDISFASTTFYYQKDSGTWDTDTTDAAAKWIIPNAEKVGNILIGTSFYQCTEGAGKNLLDSAGSYGARISSSSIWGINNELDDTINRLGNSVADGSHYGQDYIIDGDFDNWDDSSTPTDWTKVGETADAYAEENVNGLLYHCGSNGDGFTLYQQYGTAGKKYVCKLNVVSMTAGKSMKITQYSSYQAYGSFSGTGEKTISFTAGVNGYIGFTRNSYPIDCVINDFKLYEELDNGVLIPVRGSDNIKCCAYNSDIEFADTQNVGKVAFNPTDVTDTSFKLPICADLKQIDTQISDVFYTGDTPNTVNFADLQENYNSENLVFGNSTKKQLAIYSEKLTKQGYIYQDKIVLDDFSSLTPWDTLYQATQEQIATKYGYGVKVTGNTAGDYAYTMRDYNQVVNDIIGCHFYVENPATLQYVYLEIIQGIHRFAIKINSTGQLKYGWNTLAAYKEDLTKEGGTAINWDNAIDQIKLKALAQSGQIPVFTVSELFVSQKANPKLLLTFDGAYTEIYEAFQYLNSLGLKGTLFISCYHIGFDSNYMSLAQVQEIAAAGWTIGIRTYGDITDYGLITLEEVQADYELAIAYCQDNGLGTPKHIAIAKPWTELETNFDDIKAVWQSLGFKTARNTNAYFEVAPVQDYYNINAVSGSAVSISDLKSLYINKAVNAKTNLSIYYHQPDNDFKEAVKYALSLNMDIVTMDDWYNNTKQNTIGKALNYF